MSYEEYPKVMRHPAEKPAIVSQWVWDKDPNTGAQLTTGRHIPEHGEPAKFQPVTVHNRDQEEEYEAKGYRAAGKSDPGAYEKAQASAEPQSYDFQEYPKWVGDKIVNSREEEDALMGMKAAPAPAAAKPKRKTYAERTKATPADQQPASA